MCACLATGAAAAPRRIELAPPDTEVAIRAYGMGLLPLDGTFAQFHGSLTYDPEDHSTCRVELTIDVASLAMTNTSMRETMIGPDFMDAPHFPTLTYSGACQPSGLSGMLGLHGVTRPFQLSLDLEPGPGRRGRPADPRGLGHDRDADSSPAAPSASRSRSRLRRNRTQAGNDPAAPITAAKSPPVLLS